MKKLSLQNLYLDESNMLSAGEKKNISGGASNFDYECCCTNSCIRLECPEGFLLEALGYCEN